LKQDVKLLKEVMEERRKPERSMRWVMEMTKFREEEVLIEENLNVRGGTEVRMDSILKTMRDCTIHLMTRMIPGV